MAGFSITETRNANRVGQMSGRKEDGVRKSRRNAASFGEPHVVYRFRKKGKLE